MGDVFHKVTRPACIVLFQRAKWVKHSIRVADLSNYSKAEKPVQITNSANFVDVTQADINNVPGLVFVTSSLAPYSLWAKVRTSPHDPLERLVDEDGIQRGVSPDLKDAFLVDSKTAKKARLESVKLRPVLTGGKHVRRYYIDRPDLLLIYTNRDDDVRQLQNSRAYIDQFRSRITCK